MKESIYSVCLRAVVNALGQSKNGDCRVFIKFSCCSLSQLERIRRVWSNVPWIFLYRDPVETIVSNMSNPPAWLLDKDRRILAHITGTSPAHVADMSLEELCARSIGSFFSTAHSLANDTGLLLNYNQLSLSVISNALRFFGVEPTAAEIDAINNCASVYSKSAEGRPFVSDAETKRQNASELIRDVAERWAIGPYSILELRRS